MPFNSDLPADNSRIRYSAGYIRDNFKAIEACIGNDYLTTGRGVGFQPGTSMWFYQDTAPLGWTTVTTVGDSLLGVRGPDTSVYTTGGQVQGTWQLPDHQLTIAEMPSHSHTYERYPNYQKQPENNNSYGNRVADYVQWFHYTPTSSVGDNQPHNHGNGWRPQALVGIICTKN